jgi:deoxyribose-phosphate aldolase
MMPRGRPKAFTPLPATYREEAVAAASWLAEHEGQPVPDPVARTVRALAACIDETLLAPIATPGAVAELCAGAIQAGFAAVCVSPIHVALAVKELAGSRVCVATVVGFPSGAHCSDVKAAEAARAIDDGAREIDMVAPLGLLRARMEDAVRADIAAVVKASSGRTVKVILETAALDDDEKIRGVRLAREAGAIFVKTSTGFGPGGATENDVALLRREAGMAMGVKASGGIRTAVAALRMIGAGADRIGTSSGKIILAGASA